jgi:hypothetical protein
MELPFDTRTGYFTGRNEKVAFNFVFDLRDFNIARRDDHFFRDKFGRSARHKCVQIISDNDSDYCERELFHNWNSGSNAA